jgi:hypothetical protein
VLMEAQCAGIPAVATGRYSAVPARPQRTSCRCTTACRRSARRRRAIARGDRDRVKRRDHWDHHYNEASPTDRLRNLSWLAQALALGGDLCRDPPAIGRGTGGPRDNCMPSASPNTAHNMLLLIGPSV